MLTRVLLAGVATFALMSAPALAQSPKPGHSDPGGNHQMQGQGQNQGQNQGQKSWNKNTNQNQNTAVGIGKGGKADANATGGKANSSSNSSGYADANSGSDSGASSDNSQTGDHTDVNAWGFSYVDSAPQVPQGVIAEQVVVTSQNLKVLGPVFGYAWQSIGMTPAGLHSTADLVQEASTNDQTAVGRSKQASMLATLCTYKPELADKRFGDDACDRIGEIVTSTKE